MLFRDRVDAGNKLAMALEPYKNRMDTVVLGLARGGIVIAERVADQLNLPLDVLIVKKMGAPDNEELAIGAVTDTGETFLNKDIIAHLGLSSAFIEEERRRQLDAARTRGNKYRGNRLPLDVKSKTALLVDDGIATGASMHVAVDAIRQRGAHKIIVCVPVAALESLTRLKTIADDVICLDAPIDFEAVGIFYRDFAQTTDQEVIHLLSLRNP